jgi:ATP-dependent DNA helicase DinG
MQGLRELFGPTGALARSLRGFVPRSGQQRMAERIAEALQLREVLLVEAGTGTGKTFAYLVPALLSGRRVLISTGTRTLQDQLFARDLPLLGAALGRPVRTALLKGRANYLCRARLDSGATQGELLNDAGGALLARVREWAELTRTGDLAELSDLADTHPLRPRITSTRENCTGGKCAEFARCHVFAARRAALEAELIVVNHHLLLADLALKEDGFGDLLPSVDALILDEAHQLPDLAAEFFGTSCSSRQLDVFLQDLRVELRLAGTPARKITPCLRLLEEPLHEALAALRGAERRIAWAELSGIEQGRLEALPRAIGECAAAVAALLGADKSAGLQARAAALALAITTIQSTDASQGARSVVVSARGFTLSLLPYDISERFHGLVHQHPTAWVFTSATLALAGDFGHFSTRLGLKDAETLCLESPFDYERQGLLFLPKGLPDPSALGYTEAVIEAARPLIAAADGGAFLLFTSHRALALAARLLRSAEPERLLLVQGEGPREHLLRRFRESGRAVLLGTASFWEGVDVQGAALRLVVIDKLPFTSPDDPLLRARVEYLKNSGGNPFRDYQLPEAALALKQGVGRLIRSEQDRGVVAICDPRLTGRGYGRSFLAVLPPFPVTRDAEAACALLRECALDLVYEHQEEGRMEAAPPELTQNADLPA